MCSFLKEMLLKPPTGITVYQIKSHRAYLLVTVSKMHIASILWRKNPHECRFEKFKPICDRTSCDDKHTAKQQGLWSG